MNKKQNLSGNYIESTHRVGKISCGIAVLLILMVPAVITIIHGKDVVFNFPNTISAIVSLTAIYGVVSLVEVVSFSPLLGSGGTYLSFITGNIMNMKLPVATNALRVNNLKRGSEEGEVIATLAIGASSLITTLILFLGMLFLGRILVPIITGPALSPAFNNVTPALTGALAAPYFAKNKRLAIPTVIAGVVIYLVMGQAYMSAHYSYWMMGFIAVCFLTYLLMYKIGYVSDSKK